MKISDFSDTYKHFRKIGGGWNAPNFYERACEEEKGF